MNSSLTLQDVFTPSSPAKSAFVERESVNFKLISALSTPGKQIVVYGHSGVGKTTLLENKLEQLYSYHFVTRCNKNLSFDQLMLNAFDEVNGYYISEKSNKKSKKISAKAIAEYLAFKAEVGLEKIDETTLTSQRIVPPQLTAQNLAKFIGLSDGCWVLEDFHKIRDSEKSSLSQVMKTFMDMSRDYGSVKVIAIGAVGTAHEVVKYDSEMKDRVAEILVPQMTSDEIKEIIEIGESLLNIKFIPEVKDRIIEYSDGVPSVCHQLCFNMCFSLNVLKPSEAPIEFSLKDFYIALQHYLDGCSDTIKSVFDKAFHRKKVVKFHNAKIILGAMVVLGGKNLSTHQIFQEILKNTSNYPSGNLTTYLHQLEQENYGAAIYRNPNSELYSFTQPTYFAFAKTLFDLEERAELERRRKHLNEKIENGDFKSLMDQAIKNLAFEFQKLSLYKDPSEGAILSKGIKTITLHHKISKND